MKLWAVQGCFLILALFSVAVAEEDVPKRESVNGELHASRHTALVKAAEVASESVVSIGAEKIAQVRQHPFFEEFGFPFFFERQPSVRQYRMKTPYLGSGVVVSDAGYVITNHHVVEGANRVFVTLACGREYEAELVDYDALSDLAVLKIESDVLTPATLGDSEDIRIGEWVMAIGNPYGAALGDPSPSVTAGVVSATRRFFRTTDQRPRFYENMIQTDAAINPGNSGGALVNALGEVVGINTFIFSESGGSEGIGFALPINKVKAMLEEIEKYGHLRQPRLDFQVLDLTDYVREMLDIRLQQGVVLYRMETGGAASDAGLEPGDVITHVDGRLVRNRREFLIHLLGAGVGKGVRLSISRSGEALVVEYVMQADGD